MDYSIQMVDLKQQYLRLKEDIDHAIFETIQKSQFIKGHNFNAFQNELAEYLSVAKLIACGNGTDALQIAMMALDLKPGDEVIVPAFTYVATAEVIGLLGLTPVMVDVDQKTFNITADIIEEAITEKTKLIVPVHLFGQCTDMEPIMKLAGKNNLKVIEDTAQAIGAEYRFSDGESRKAGCIGDIGTTSFFPSKNLGCYGDGGAVFSNNLELAEKMRMVANHGQSVQYVHDIIGINSRLDEIQAAILRVKLQQLDDFALRRNLVANHYDKELSQIEYLEIPYRQANSTHVFHQYTIKVKNNLRNDLKDYLKSKEIPAMIYYPKPLHKQKAFENLGKIVGNLEVSSQLCSEVLSLPIHTEMNLEQLNYITDSIKSFFNGK
ncbi:DegT/DnrJ/EryC1/StrS family aminotransferase [Lacihabitans soyangensis]|nr:DegT/DnrJ/EryC1/StrS family aminotransferase [Lacihabitans soyangensis]